MLLCNGTDSDPTSVKVVCDNLSTLSQSIQFSTSIPKFCEAKPYELCNDSFFNKTLCKDNDVMFDNSTLCKLYPSKCELGSSNMDWCAFNAYECLLDQTWDFCVSFPELCATKPTYHYAKKDDLGKAICDNATFCDNSVDDFKSARICIH
jgi:hypothetical protein